MPLEAKLPKNTTAEQFNTAAGRQCRQDHPGQPVEPCKHCASPDQLA